LSKFAAKTWMGEFENTRNAETKFTEKQGVENGRKNERHSRNNLPSKESHMPCVDRQKKKQKRQRCIASDSPRRRKIWRPCERGKTLVTRGLSPFGEARKVTTLGKSHRAGECCFEKRNGERQKTLTKGKEWVFRPKKLRNTERKKGEKRIDVLRKRMGKARRPM